MSASSAENAKQNEAPDISSEPDLGIDVSDAEAVEENRNTSIESLEAQIEALKLGHQKEMAELREQTLRALAEAENTRKRGERELQDTSKYAIANFARDLVGVIENLQRAAASIPDEAKQGSDLLKNMAIGIDMTMKEFLAMLERHGIKRIDPPAGEKFDHNLHQAMSQVETTDHEPGVILHVLQAGYLIHDRLLRPAMVSVSKRPNAPQIHVDTEA
ncbi:MAG: nucleotide exchange factor GrpE [Rickettsiales bacterium]